MKCNRVGCDKEGFHVEIPILGGMAYADAYFCQEHYREGLDSFRQSESQKTDKTDLELDG